MRWVGSVFMILIGVVVIRDVWCDHPLNESMKGFLTDLAYTILGGGVIRKGIEVAGSSFGNNSQSPPST